MDLVYILQKSLVHILNCKAEKTIHNYKCRKFWKISGFSGRLKDSTQRQCKFVTSFDARHGFKCCKVSEGKTGACELYFFPA